MDEPAARFKPHQEEILLRMAQEIVVQGITHVGPVDAVDAATKQAEAVVAAYNVLWSGYNPAAADSAPPA